MKAAQWYLIAYDVSDPRRLQRTHRLLRRQALSAQRSVFFFQGTASQLVQLLDGMAALLHRHEDDLRAYPIEHPTRVWLAGQKPMQGPLLGGDSPAGATAAGGIKRLLDRFWRRHER